MIIEYEYKEEWKVPCEECHHARGDHGANEASCLREECRCTRFQDITRAIDKEV